MTRRTRWFPWELLTLASAAFWLAGCGGQAASETSENAAQPGDAQPGDASAARVRQAAAAPKANPAPKANAAPRPADTSQPLPIARAAASSKSPAEARPAPEGRVTGTLADLIEGDSRPFVDPAAAARGAGEFQPPPSIPVDAGRAAAAGIRQLKGRHVDIYTDLPSAPDVDDLPAAFDAAFAPWCAYFDHDPKRLAAWRMTGFVMREGDRFRAAGLFPADLPDFPHGFQRHGDFWVWEQPSAYYRRHLVIHEGTHGFMYTVHGGTGPPWYREGMAEWFGTHRWRDGTLVTGHSPPHRDEAPHWGRVKMITDELAAGRGLGLPSVMKFELAAHRKTEAYAWSWAACYFLENHPLSHDAFRGLRLRVTDESPSFSGEFIQRLADDWPKVSEQWQLFVVEQEYGYDVARAAVSYAPGAPLPPGGAKVEVRADAGWQSTGARLEAGRPYLLAATGRFQIAAEPKTWWCEPNGVTIRYHRGRPLGELAAAVRPDDWRGESLTPLAKPTPIGARHVLTPAASGTLYLRVNEGPAGLADNAGRLVVEITAE